MVTNIERIPTKVLEKLYLGGIFDASRKDSLLKLGIKYILIVGNNMEPLFPNDFVYKTIEIEDEPDVNIEVFFDESYKFIKEGIDNGGCFVHWFFYNNFSAFGASRSVSMIISFLMKENSWRFIEAYEFVKSKRKVTSPNPGFVLQLRFYEVTLGLRTNEELEKDLEENKYVRNMKYL